MKKFLVVASVIILIVFIIAYFSPESVYENTNAVLNTGHITTFVDGADVGSVNLWSSTGSERRINYQASNQEAVNILGIEGEYYFVQSILSPNSKGYCLKGFVILNNDME